MQPFPAATARDREADASGQRLTPVEQEMVAFFVGLAQVLGLPRSLGEIYGLTYASPQPVCLGDLCERLGMSKGSASQGLRLLVTLGALKPVYVPGERRDFFEPERSLKLIVSRLLGERLQPHLASGRARLDRMQSLLAQGAVDPLVLSRVNSLRTWHGKAEKLLPWVGRFLG